MDSSKHGSSETSSNENDHPEKVNDDNAGTGRSYGCTFCKRGFTNAQALGGHMNIHRKDKAKTKAKKITEASMSKKADSTPFKYFAPVSNEQAHYYAALGAQMNYQMYFPASNPSFPYAYHSRHLTTDTEYLGANLSLQIAPPLVEDSKQEKKDGRRKRKGNEVDLELRLGHNP